MKALPMRRRREQKTDYKNRLGLLRSRKIRLVIRRSLNGVRMQLVKYEEKGDKTLLEVTSSALRKYGWKCHTGNMPAAYLTGLVLGRQALRQGINEGVVDLGLNRAINGSLLFAAAKGCKDAGVNVSIGDEALPRDERVRGSHIAEYANKLKSDREKYRKQFSGYLKDMVEPEKIPEHFEEIKSKIIQIIGEKS